MSKRFNDILEAKLDVFQEFKKAPELVSFISNGIPVGIACYLRKLIIEDPKQEVKVKFGDIMEFSLKVGKRGDSVSLTPDFKLLEKGLELIKKDKLNVSMDDFESLGLTILENEDLVVALREGIAGKIYNDSDWIDANKDDKEKGLEFSEESDVTVVTAGEILSIIEILTNAKNPAEEVSYDVPMLGTFIIKEVKGEWVVSLSPFDKAYKGHIKSDAATAAISSIEI